MNVEKLVDLLIHTALKLDPNIIHTSSTEYPKDLGSWALEEKNLDKLKSSLSKLAVELKVYDLNEDEFPSFKGRNLVELEINSNQSSYKKTIEVLRSIKAFRLETYHIANKDEKEDDEKEYPTGEGQGYDIVVDNAKYVKKILHGNTNFYSMEEIKDIVGYNSYGVRWDSVILSKDKKQIEAKGTWNDHEELQYAKDKEITIKVNKKNGKDFEEYELSWIKRIKQASTDMDKEILKTVLKMIPANTAKNEVQRVFSPNHGELNKYFSDIKGKVTYEDDEGSQYSEITGTIKKEWIDKYFGKDVELSELEKELSSHSGDGPGQGYSHITISIKRKKDDYEFTIHSHTGLDI